MPASTPLGITYPCSGDTIDPAVFKTYADTTQAAITNTWAIALNALYPPAAQARQIGGQTFNSGVSTTISWNTQAYDSSPGGLMFVPPSTVFTVQAPGGSFLIGTNIRIDSDPGSLTSLRVALLVNGVEQSAFKADCGSVVGTVSTEFGTSFFAPGLVAGNTISVVCLYTGAASPIGITGAFSATRVSTG